VSETARPPSGQLLKILGLAFGVALLVGNSIGMGILRTPGVVASHLPSAPLFMMVWVAGAAYALFGAMTVAELGAMRPRSGGLYPIVHHALGPYPGFLSGWTDWISNCGSVGAVAIVIGEYVAPLVPPLLGREPLTASLVVLGFALLQWRGVRFGDLAQQITSLTKALALIGLAGVALFMTVGASPAAVVDPTPPVVPMGFALVAAVLVAMQSAVFTYDGWGGPLYFAEEMRDPGRDVPRAMITGVLVVLGIYLVLNLAFVRVLSVQAMAGDPFVAATLAERLFGPSGDTVLRILMIVSLMATVNGVQLLASRIPFAMSRDRFLPEMFQRVNPGGTPVPALAMSALLALIFIGTNTFDTVLAFLAFFMVANYTLAFLAIFVLRRREPETHRPFRVPGYPWIPGVVLLGSLGYLIGSLVGDSANTWAPLLILALSWPVHRIIRWRTARG
jgi:APA family basic amino acid/polyamine antiporter